MKGVGGKKEDLGERGRGGDGEMRGDIKDSDLAFGKGGRGGRRRGNLVLRLLVFEIGIIG